jgi:hypothetical protein
VDKVLQDEPDEASYQKLKDCLLATHTLTPFQMVKYISSYSTSHLLTWRYNIFGVI